jgi:hypothetical protein
MRADATPGCLPASAFRDFLFVFQKLAESDSAKGEVRGCLDFNLRFFATETLTHKIGL